MQEACMQEFSDDPKRLINFVCVYMACRTFAWQIKGVLATAGRLPDDGHGNHCTVFDDHKCPVTALAISACNSMMASADASGRIVVRFSLQQP